MHRTVTVWPLLALACAAAGTVVAQPVEPPAPAPVAEPAAAPAAPPPAPPAAAAAEMRPYEASYSFVWRGMNAGSSSFALRQESAEEWSYVSSNQPRGLFRLFSAASLTLRSRMHVGPDGVRPLRFSAAQADGSAPQADVQFDWVANRATGIVEGTKIDMALKAGVQDDLSVQIALIHALAAGQTPSGISVFDKKGIRDYGYARVGEETLHTPLGDVATLVYRSQRLYSPRSTRFWCAPAYGFVPVRAEQQRDGQVEWTMDLRALRRD